MSFGYLRFEGYLFENVQMWMLYFEILSNLPKTENQNDLP